MQGQQTQQGQGQQQGQWQQQQKQHARNKTVFSFTADIPPGQFAPLAQRLEMEPGFPEITLLRDGTTPRIRVKVAPESIATVQQVLTQVLQNLQQTYAGSGSYSG